MPTVREGGIIVTIAGPPPQEPGLRGDLLIMSPSAEQLARIAELVAAGHVRIELADLPLSEVQRAHELSESGHTRGKIVLSVGT